MFTRYFFFKRQNEARSLICMSVYCLIIYDNLNDIF